MQSFPVSQDSNTSIWSFFGIFCSKLPYRAITYGRKISPLTENSCCFFYLSLVYFTVGHIFMKYFWVYCSKSIFFFIQFTVCVAWLLCIAAYDHVSHLVRGRYLLFLVVGVICWLFVLFVIFWNLCSCYNRCLQNNIAKLNAWVRN